MLHQRQPVLFRTIQRGVEPGETYASALAAEVQRTLATVMIGSTLSQSLLSLLVVPVLYHLVHRRDSK